jgi:hypothetical protein
MKRVKVFIAGVVLGALLMTVSPVLAETVDIAFNAMHITVNGKSVVADNFLYNGTTYVPLRAIAEMLGLDVSYDASTNTAAINSKSTVVQTPSSVLPQKKDLTNNPTVKDVKSAITGIDSIKNIEIVTEDHDPNGQLVKQGGYTGCLYFKSPLVTGETEKSSIDAGTDGGGCIEIYANNDDAEKRDKYLSTFDGGAFSSGSHSVLGTLVIRTSNNLKASQQKELERKIVAVLKPE